jgi:hypothetical protein
MQPAHESDLAETPKLICPSGNQQAPTTRPRVKTQQNLLREKTNFTSHFNAIWVVQIARQKYTASLFPKWLSSSRHPAS